MSRDRPTEPPRVVPDVADFKRAAAKLNAIEERKLRQLSDAEKLKTFSGASFMGWLGATFSRGALKRAPQFIRRGYESGIVDELNAFYARRPRPWRPARCAPKPNRKTLPRRLGLKAMIRRQEPHNA